MLIVATGEYGENLYMTSGGESEGKVAKEGCLSWYAEVASYSYPGEDQAYDQCGVSFSSVGHLTQASQHSHYALIMN